jgi:hypothetical protein
MTEKNEALRLADLLAAPWPNEHEVLEAAAELRRLHEAHDWQYKMAGERLRRIEKLEAQRDALLEALKLMLEQFTKTPSTLKDSEARIKAHAAIAQTEGQ